MSIKALASVVTLAIIGLGGFAADARAGLRLNLTNGSYSESITADPATPGRIVYANASFNGNLEIDTILAKSNSAIDGPTVLSQLSIGSFSVTNLTNQAQTLTIAASDIDFDPDNSIRPLFVYNTASATSSQMNAGTLSYQTFAYDGTDYFRTSGNGVVATDPVAITLPFSGSNTTVAPFTPLNAQFSLTSVMTLTLAPGASIAGFNGVSLVHAPEPGTIALVISALPIVATGWLRRRGAGPRA